MIIIFYLLFYGIAILSMFVGNILAIRQKNIKRLLEYVSIANMGYLIILLLTGTSKEIHEWIFYLISSFYNSRCPLGDYSPIDRANMNQKKSMILKDFSGEGQG